MRARQRFRLFALALIITVSSTAAHAQFSVLYDFGSQSIDPYLPVNSGIVARGRDGNLYTGPQGGAFGYGAFFQVTPSGALNVLYSFSGGKDGSHPWGGVTLGTDGNFYGTTSGAGGLSGYGTVFKNHPGRQNPDHALHFHRRERWRGLLCTPCQGHRRLEPMPPPSSTGT
jgi:uncharacterized repeat protein (TIGR03803 family)